MSKNVKYVVSVVLKNSQDEKQFLIVKRPADDPDLAGGWGFPSVSLKAGELPEDGAKRVCNEKLGCKGNTIRFLGIMYQKRNNYDLFLMDIEVMLENGLQPDVHKSNSTSTTYVEQKWSKDPMDLMPSAKLGSCCSSIFLLDQNILNRDDLINSLEGSALVG